MARMPEAEWKPIPTSNYAQGAIGGHKGLQLHHTESTMSSADGWFHNPSSQASAHFGVARDGHIIQWVDTNDAAYAACQSNYEGWVSVENEGFGDEGLTDQQIASCGQILRWLHETHGVQVKVSQGRYDGGVSYHNMIPGPCSQAWGQTSCPGPTIPTQRQAVVDAALGGSAPAPAGAGEDEEVIFKTTDNGVDTYYREARGFLLVLDPGTAAALFFGGAKVVFLGGGLAAIGWNASTKAQFLKLGVQP